MSQALFGVYGASGCGRGILPLARAQLARQKVDPNQLVFVDDGDVVDNLNGHRVLSYREFVEQPAAEKHIAIAVANGRVRQTLAANCETDGLTPWSISADNVVTMDDVSIGDGALLSPFVTLTSNIRIGRYFHGNLYSYVEHDCSIGDFVTFGPGAKCNGNIVIEDQAYIGSGAVLKQGAPGKPLRIGAGAVVGMGAVVTKDVANGTTVVGNPARPLQES